MAISKRKRRKIVYEDAAFLWWVEPLIDDSGNMLRISIASENKKFVVKYYAVQAQPAQSFMTILGTGFPTLQRKSGQAINIPCPDFSLHIEDKGISPKMIKEILKWCFEDGV